MDRLVRTEEFAEAFQLDSNNIVIHFAIQSGATTVVEQWIDSTLVKEVGELSIRQLRSKAAQLGIPYYTSLNKQELISKILKVQHARKAQETAVSVPYHKDNPSSQNIN